MVGERAGSMDDVKPFIRMVEGERADAEQQRDNALGFGEVGWASNKKSVLHSAPMPEKPKVSEHRPDDYASHDVPKARVNTAYGSAPDDYADTGLARPPKVNTAYGSAPDEYADSGLINAVNTAYGSSPDGLSKTGMKKPPKVNTAYGSRPDDLADTGLGKSFKVNTAYGSAAEDLADTGVV